MARPAPADPVLEGEIIEIIAASRPASAPQPGEIRPRLDDLSEIRCVLFDVYGTLFTSASGDVGTAQTSSAEEHFALALSRAGFELAGEGGASEVRRRYFHEIERRHAAQRARGVDYPEVDIAEVWGELLSGLTRDAIVTRNGKPKEHDDALRAAAWYEALSNPVAPMPSAGSTLEGLRAAGRLLGIVSNAQFYTPLLFPALMGGDFRDLGFREDICAWSYRLGRAKPSVDIFTPILMHLAETDDMAPESVLYVGNDMLNDVWTAQRAGCRTALFAGDARSLRLRRDDPRCAGLRPDVIVLELTELLNALGIAPPDGAEGNTE